MEKSLKLILTIKNIVQKSVLLFIILVNVDTQMYKMHKVKTLRCIICNKEFYTTSPGTKYCSKICKNKNQMRNKPNECYICKCKDNIHTHHILQLKDDKELIVYLCKNHHILIHQFMKMLEFFQCSIVKTYPTLVTHSKCKSPYWNKPKTKNQ